MESDKKDNKNTDKNEYMRLALTIFAETSGWIAFPVIGALFLGRWLDEKQGTEPLYYLSITGLAFVISSVGLGITGVKYMKKIESSTEAQTEDKKNISNNKLNTLSKAEGKKKQNNESRNRK